MPIGYRITLGESPYIISNG